MRRAPIVNKISQINELTRRATNKTMEKVGERIALTKNWVLDEPVENVKKAITLRGNPQNQTGLRPFMNPSAAKKH